MDAQFIPRLEHERTIERIENRMDDHRDEVLDAIRDLKLAMNGQFGKQEAATFRHGEVLGKHGTDIAVLQDRSQSDWVARGLAGVGALIAAIFGMKG